LALTIIAPVHRCHHRLVQLFACGDRHEGFYDQDKRHHYGVYTWQSGDKYSGFWEHGRMSGRGIKHMANDDVYDGEWKDDKAHGWGTKAFANGDHHQGNRPRGGGATDGHGGRRARPQLSLDLDTLAASTCLAVFWARPFSCSKELDLLSSSFVITPLCFWSGDYVCDVREGLGMYTWANGDSYEGAQAFDAHGYHAVMVNE
jgi:hypothetical protein